MITYEAVKKIGACDEGLAWLKEHGPCTPLDIPQAEWCEWAIKRMPEECAPYLTELADDSSWQVRGAVAGNRFTPLEILARLAQDRDWYVRAAVAGNPSTPPEILVRLANDSHAGVRHAVADNIFTPPKYW